MDNKKLYAVLRVEPTATADEIKRSYRRLALQLHPDKSNREEDAQLFREVNAAWEILGDEKLRSIYDRHGMPGIEMYRQFGDSLGVFLTPEAEGMIMTGFCFLSFLVLFVSLFPIFIALKGDGVVDWSWAVVFVPVWIIDVFAFLIIVSRYFLWKSDNRNNQNDSPNAGGDAATASDDGSETERKDDFQDYLLGAKRVLEWALFVLFQIFLVIKLDGVVSWQWAAVFAPWFCLEGLNWLNLCVQYIFIISSPLREETENDSSSLASTRYYTFPQKLVVLFEIFHVWLLRVILAILIVLNADIIITVSWAVVFIPVFIQFGIMLFAPIMTYVYNRRTWLASAQDDRKFAMKAMVISRTVVTVVLGTLFFAMLGMFIARLDMSNYYSLSAILTPLFVLLGLTFCCVCCCLPCSFMAQMPEPDTEASQSTRPPHDFGMPLRQIEWKRSGNKTVVTSLFSNIKN